MTYRSLFFSDEPLVGEDRPQISALEFSTEFYVDVTPVFDITVRPYLRYEHLSEDNVHTDLREFMMRRSADNWELRFGIGQEFWGVAESKNIVDTINQNDFTSDFTDDEKLGQPMLQFSWYSGYGDLSFYLLPLFREPEYAGVDSRPRTGLQVNSDLTTYESEDEDSNIDVALRWSNSFNELDVGVHYFNGTLRQPTLTPTEDGFASRFHLVNQVGIDAQVTADALLGKLEYLYQEGEEVDGHSEIVAGVEYTLSQVLGGDAELGLLAEVLYDTREDEAGHALQKDYMFGLRLALNDADSTEMLVTMISDFDYGGKIYQLTFDRRIGRNFTVGLSGNWWRDASEDRLLNPFATEDNVQVDFNWFF